MKNKIGTGAGFGAQMESNKDVHNYIAVKNIYHFEAFDKDGSLKWEAFAENVVVNEGLDDLLDKYLKGSAYTAAFYVLLTDGTPTTDATDTMASHSGWAEVTAYSESARGALTLGTVSGQSVDNSASKASFSITADATTIGGAGITRYETNGLFGCPLYSVAAFSIGDKSLDNGDTLNVTATCTAASA